MNIDIILPHIETAMQIVKETEVHTDLPAKIEALGLDTEITKNLLEFARAHYRIVGARRVVAHDFAFRAAELWAEHEKERELGMLVADRFDIGTIGGDHNVRHAIFLAAKEKLTYVGDAREILRHYDGPLFGLDVIEYLMDNKGLREDVAGFARFLFWRD